MADTSNGTPKAFRKATNRNPKPALVTKHRRTQSEKFKRNGQDGTSVPITRSQSQKGSQFFIPLGQRLSVDTLTELQKVSDKQKQLLTNIDDINIGDYVYPFENLVFEGGGAKGYAYLGCIQVMEEVGVKATRFAGTSIGAMTATLLACGYDAQEAERVLGDTDRITKRHWSESCCMLRNLFRHYGVSAGASLTEYIGEIIEERFGTPDITFKELYDKTGNELCIISVNVNMMATEYLHAKTTPNMKIKTAVRMSTSIPGYFEAVQNTSPGGHEDYFIDGGLLCNYPIHAFDGWWLSMKPSDSFLQRLTPLSEINILMDKRRRFGTYNEKTLGFQLYAEGEIDLMQQALVKRVGLDITKRPNTILSRKKEASAKIETQIMHEHAVFFEAFELFMAELRRVNNKAAEYDDVIDYKEFEEVFNAAKENKSDEGFKRAHLDVLFGKDAGPQEVFNTLDDNSDGTIAYDELIQFIEKSGILIQERFVGHSRRTIRTFTDFLLGIEETLLTNVKRLYTEELDQERTVGIDTDYIQTTDFILEDADKEFLIEQGRKSTISFLKHYVNKYKPPLKPERTASTRKRATTLNSSTISRNSNAGKISQSEEISTFINKAVQNSAGESENNTNIDLPVITQQPQPANSKTQPKLRESWL